MADKTLTEKINQGRQYRTMQLCVEKREANEDKKYIVKGYATTFNEEYTLWDCGDWELREKVDSHAFDKTDLNDCILQFDHAGAVFARSSNGTLKLSIDEHGLLVEADLSKTEKARSLYEDIESGMITKMSFGFTVEADEELRATVDGKDIYTRTITRIGKLYDVSAVSLPANDGTEISARSLIDGVIAKRMAESANEEAEKKAEEEKKAAEEKARQEAEERANKEKQERERLALELELTLSL